ncbi:MAG: helix-hairpin-helix domain-containing protein [Propionibacteriaceae bacterium]|nr:helix-hairpin-helix domain-containing protein [Propionibacteriaceae bacterium]
MAPFSSRPVHGDVVRQRLDALVAELGWAEAEPAAGAGSTPPDPVAEQPVTVPEEPAPARAVGSGGHVPRRALARAWSFGRTHAAVIGVVALVALVGAVWSITQARTIPVAVASTPSVVAPSSGAVAGAPASASASASASPEPVVIRVHVVGAVAAPGVVRLPEGARVEDALAAAGGLLPEARPGELNLAAVVGDGSQVLVGDGRNPGGEIREAAGAGGGTAGGGGSGGAAGGGGRLDLNRATQEQFDALPGVGPVTAQAIVEWRTARGKFSSVQELMEVDGIGAKTFERLSALVTV